MRFGGQRAEAHRAGAEALDDFACGLDFVERHGVAREIEVEQAAQRARLAGFLVDVGGKLLVRVLVAAARRHLQREDCLRIPGVALAGAAPMEFAGVRQRRQLVGWVVRITEGVAAQRFLFEDREIDALEAADRAAEAALDDFVGNAERLENLPALVGLQRRDAHFRHDLEHALRNGLPIIADEIDVGIEQPLVARLHESLECQIGVDAVRAVADEQAMVMNLARFAGLDDDADARALRAIHEMVVHRSAREQGAHRHAVRADGAVRQHD